MKNIHVLPTDKPSRLYYNSNQKHYRFNFNVIRSSNCIENQNIYITSDEEIKEGDYFIAYSVTIDKKPYISCASEYKERKKEKGKIILTTDVDLIKDGIQAIDDEFLEWFVKNPGCEEVETIYEPKNYLDTKQGWEYLIIIPKEEVLLQSSIDGKPIWGEAIKQDTIDTLEYGLLQHIKTCLECNNESQVIRLLEKYGFEKQEGLYSEEDMLEASEYGYNFHKTTQFPEQEFKDS